MRGLVFIEHNAVARHFLHNNTFDLLGSTHDIKYIFPEKNHRRISQLEPEALNLNGDFEHLPIPPHRQKIWKWLYLVDQLRWKEARGRHIAFIPDIQRRFFSFWVGEISQARMLPACKDRPPGMYSLLTCVQPCHGVFP